MDRGKPKITLVKKKKLINQGSNQEYDLRYNILEEKMRLTLFSLLRIHSQSQKFWD